MTASLIELRGIGHRYSRADRDALDDVTLSIERGEFVAIIGPSGSGKSTLLNVLGLLENPTRGEYLIDGVPTGTMTEQERNHARSNLFGFVFQSANVLGDDTVWTNATLGLRIQGLPDSERDQIATRALADVDLDLPVTQRARLLSGGERQRLAIARALATKPAVVFADEPTGNLDSVNGNRVMELLTGLHQRGQTLILVTHDPDIAQTADRVLTIKDGRLTDDTGSSQPRTSAPLTPPPAKTQIRTVLRDDIADAVRALINKPFRSLLLLASFMIGIAGLICAQGLSESASAQVNQRLTDAALDGITVSVPLTDPADTETTFSAKQALERLAKQQAALESIPHVVQAEWSVGLEASDVRFTRVTPWEAELATSAKLLSVSPDFFTSGKATVTPSSAAGLLHNPEVGPGAVVGANAAEALSIPTTGDLTGIRLWINGISYPVVGVAQFPKNDAALTMHNDTVYLPLSHMPSTSVLSMQTKFEVKTDHGYPATVAPAIPATLSPADPSLVHVQTVADMVGLRVGVADDLSRFVLVLSVVVLVLACLAGTVAMYLSVVARTPEIALRRALGTSRPTVFRLFLLEALMVGVLGGVIGAIAGQLLTLGIATSMEWQPVLSTTTGVLGLAVGIGCGLIAGSYPAIAAARRSPAQAIRD